MNLWTYGPGIQHITSCSPPPESVGHPLLPSSFFLPPPSFLLPPTSFLLLLLLLLLPPNLILLTFVNVSARGRGGGGGWGWESNKKNRKLMSDRNLFFPTVSEVIWSDLWPKYRLLAEFRLSQRQSSFICISNYRLSKSQCQSIK